MRSILLAAALFTGCAQTPPPPEPVPGEMEDGGTPVATVDGESVTEEMLQAVQRRLPPEAKAQMESNPSAEEQLVERLVIGELLYREALERKLHEDESVQVALAMSEREVLAAELLEKVAAAAVTEAAIKEWYDDHQVQYRRPSARVFHIVLKQADQADKVAKMARGGGDFAALAKEHSVDRGSAEKGGELGWIEKGRLVPALDKAVFEAEPGVVVGPVESSFGFHIIRVEERRELTPLEAVRDQVEQAARSEAVDGFVAELRAQANVEQVGDEEEAPAEGAVPPDVPGAPAKAKVGKAGAMVKAKPAPAEGEH